MSKILVTGATGNVGSRLVRRLKEKGHCVRAFARDVAGKTPEGVDAVYLLSAGDQLSVHEANAIEAANAAGVKLVVKHSVAGAPDKAPGFPSWPRAGEERPEASGIPYVLLRPASFASNALYRAGSAGSDGSSGTRPTSRRSRAASHAASASGPRRTRRRSGSTPQWPGARPRGSAPEIWSLEPGA